VTAEERARILVTARFLRASASIQWLAIAFMIVAATTMIFAAGRLAFATAAIVFGLVSIFYGVRVAFDARLLEDVAAGALTTADLDRVFAKNAGRPWTDRCRGAIRLVVFCAIATTAEVAAVVLIR